MNEHPELWWIVISVAALIITILIYLAKKGIKSSTDKVYICPLDRASAIDYIKRTHTSVESNKEVLRQMKDNLAHGVSVAERNTESYSKFIIVLNDLKNMINNNQETQKEILKAIKEQTTILYGIRNNGNGKGTK